jgi:hypothetical protein
MNVVQRKPRPIRRDAEFLRDDRLFIVACDDTYAPKQYFDAFRLRGVQIHVVPTTKGDSAAQHVLSRLLKFDAEEDDERWLLLDTDHYVQDGHFDSFIAAVSEARQRGIHIALSKPSFELWLLLHHVGADAIAALKNAAEAELLLRRILGTYNKTNVDMSRFPYALVPDACRRAESLDIAIPGGDRPEGNTSRVYLLWKAIIASALPAQLPQVLRVLRE